MKELDPTLPVYSVSTLEKAIADVVDSHRLFGLLFAAFALVALLLATAGIYATMSFFVARRTRELGLRVALGAEPRRVVALVVASGRDADRRGSGDRDHGRRVRRAGARAHALRRDRERADDLRRRNGCARWRLQPSRRICPPRRASAIDPMIALRAPIDHSARIATSGSTRVARRAGKYVASSVTTPSNRRDDRERHEIRRSSRHRATSRASATRAVPRRCRSRCPLRRATRPAQDHCRERAAAARRGRRAHRSRACAARPRTR